MIGYLRELRVIAPVDPEPLSPAAGLLEAYRRYLLIERALTVETARVYITAIAPFVAHFADGERVRTEQITAAAVNAFVLREATRREGTSIRTVATALRSLLGYLHVAGELKVSLTAAVPGVGAWRDAGCPGPLERAQLQRILAACTTDTIAGRRDLALVLLMARLGLRCGEVARLRLPDIDWRAGELTVSGKGRRDERLPLPVDVGDAIAGYLRHDRPARVGDRAVFVRVLAPYRGLTSSAVSRAVSYAAQRAGLGPLGAHRLRHTAATDLLRAGGTLSEVGQVLRHRQLASTAINAKVDDDRLRDIARAWPERRS